jgi:hypothetical protein
MMKANVIARMAHMITITPTLRAMSEEERQRVAHPTEGKYVEDLSAGQVEVLHITVTRALGVHLEPDDPEWVGFFLEIADRQVLYLAASFLNELVQQHRFPCCEFEVIRLPNTGKVIGVEAAVDLIEMQELDDSNWAIMPEDECVFIEYSLDGIREALATGEDDTISLASLPKEIHPDLKSQVWKFPPQFPMGLKLFAAVGLGIPLIAIGYMLYQKIQGNIVGEGAYKTLPLAVFTLIVTIIGAVNTRQNARAVLLLASKTLRNSQVVRLPVIVRGNCTQTNQSNRHYEIHARLPDDFAWQHHIPVEFDVLVPNGTLRTRLEGCPASGDNNLQWQVLLSETAGVFVGRAGNVVIATSEGFLIRERVYHVTK